MHHRRTVRTLTIAAPVASALVLALLGAASVPQATAQSQLEPGTTSSVIRQAEATSRVQLAAAMSDIGSATAAVTSARATLASSAGHVLTNTARTALAARIDDVTVLVDKASQAYVLAQRSIDSAAAIGITVDEIPTQAAGIRALGIVDTSDLRSAVALLAPAEEAVTAAVDEWKAEQERIAAEKAAQRAAQQAAQQAAQARAAAVSAPSTVRPVASSSGSSSGTISVYVRTWVTVRNAAGVTQAQSAVDAGGQVAIDYAQVGVVVVSAHNFSDSRALRLRMGDVVRFSGAMSGTYRVVSDIWVGTSTSAGALLSLGTSVAMQTCGTSNMRVVGLSRIG